MQDHQVFPDDWRGRQAPGRKFRVEFGDAVAGPDKSAVHGIEAAGMSHRAKSIDTPFEDRRRGPGTVPIVALAVRDWIFVSPKEFSRRGIETQDPLDFLRVGLPVHDEGATVGDRDTTVTPSNRLLPDDRELLFRPGRA